uniref:NADH-ubiquinone oxidoreductase chain 2 n=1 Tax=Berosus affinis TaxID=877818 RepID=A0A191ZR59_9COLE|nr:NADH dehydrogenase subunit 2 [Berosus affinis]
MLFTSTLTLGTLISISSQSWLGMWMGLEINLLSMIPLINHSNNMMASEASIKYFIVQALASTILLFSIILLVNKTTAEHLSYSILFNTALLTKMGAAPFHFWFPEVIEGLTWMNSLILLTWQKIAPMIIIMYNNTPMLFMFIIVSCMMISGVMGINQMSLRKILAYSSINHIGWMIAALMFSENIWMYYFSVYTIITMNIILIISQINVYSLNQLYMSMSENHMLKMFFILNFMSLGGLPPFLGFFPKWITIQTMSINSTLLIALVMIIMTLMTLFFYMRITFSTILLSSQMNKIYFPNNKQLSTTLVFNFISIMGLIMCTVAFNIM